MTDFICKVRNRLVSCYISRFVCKKNVSVPVSVKRMETPRPEGGDVPPPKQQTMIYICGGG